MSGFDIPVVVILFNRPDCVTKLFEVLKAVRPARLFVISDGARENVPGDAELVERCRAIAQPDWPCDVQVRYSSEHLGCRKGIVPGLDWVFERVDRAVIVEDDCYPAVEFFTYCETMLQSFEHDERVMNISGTRFFPAGGEQEVVFSSYSNCWGWATWRRAWCNYRSTLPGDYKQILGKTFPLCRARVYWWFYLLLVERWRFDSWDYFWMYTLWENEALSVYPPVNLICNIGDGPQATHTKKLPYYAATELGELGAEPLSVPAVVQADAKVDRWIEDHMYSKSFRGRLRWLADRLRLM